ncbi:tyrosyl-DNA phosphodiesterase I [Microdochium trichocladiopsis]|uniref:Tyrosyl-DNA phosphodiesterase I n=1 Tax=Microdochium trichocladiopsis TaxID=1682393 RepID=A0A9P9BQU7_9PEZI|nr:tyrosyl-DNA phosphodiesterase I [Microdochium trichocladiopsis]KAH7031277.1 tyrosyl-DNA phosphodiesterase I [Microdochium trichocladiopsis]
MLWSISRMPEAGDKEYAMLCRFCRCSTSSLWHVDAGALCTHGKRACSQGMELQRTPRSLRRPISPPPSKARKIEGEATRARRVLQSPFRLTKIRDLGPDMNVDTISLSDLLGDPLISECWQFNYLHDVDFTMSHFDEDTRGLVKVHVVHGFWKRDDANRVALEAQASRYGNVKLHAAYMPAMFGTHHSKMMILFRHDDTAQVIIHTANMIAKDWTNMTNAVWQSPLLPLVNRPSGQTSATGGVSSLVVGSGERFKHDLLSYLRAYNSRRSVCTSLVEELNKYDFAAVRGALIASVPGVHEIEPDDGETCWGWAAARKTLRSVPIQAGRKSEVVVQISSVATLGPSDTWLQKTLLHSLTSPTKTSEKPAFRIVFPTPDEIRRSLDGYASGGSIHMKIQSAQQAKQLQYMRPMLCHWANDADKGQVLPGNHHEAGRQRAAPHVKTYIRYHENSNTMDWALLTSANISKQAWGEAANAAGDIKIASWEIGVMVWPELLTGEPETMMVGTFKADSPSEEALGEIPSATLVGLRIPYNLPLRRYAATELPWVATASYSEPDWRGLTWTK